MRFLNLNVTPFDAHKMSALTLVADARAGLEALTRRAMRRATASRAAYEAEYARGKASWEPIVDSV